MVFAFDSLVHGRMVGAKIFLKMTQTKSWTVSDALWNKIKRLVPVRKRPRGRKYQRKPGAGRKPMPGGQVFSATVYVLHAGCRWKALPRNTVAPVHAHFQRWQQEGFFLKIWKAGVAEYDDMEGIAWRWQSIDGATGKAPLAVECVAPNSTDRGKKWAQAQPPGRRAWNPAVARRRQGKPA